jgi:hypothetical protein
MRYARLSHRRFIETFVPFPSYSEPESLFSSNELAFLNHLVGMNEYEVDALGNYDHRLWEWK